MEDGELGELLMHKKNKAVAGTIGHRLTKLNNVGYKLYGESVG